MLTVTGNNWCDCSADTQEDDMKRRAEFEADALRSFTEMIGRRLQGLEEKRERIGSFKQFLDDLLKEVSEEISSTERMRDDIVKGHITIAVSGPRQPEKGFRDMTIGDATAEVLREARKPLHVKEIWRRLSEGGLVLRARRPTSSVVATLLRDTRFEHVGRNQFQIRGGIQEELIPPESKLEV